MARIVGIDLGTTNSLVAYMADGRPCVISGRNERAMVPSVVAMTDNGLIVGDAAKEHLTRSPERTVYSVKRFMGKGLEDVQDDDRGSHLKKADSAFDGEHVIEDRLDLVDEGGV